MKYTLSDSTLKSMTKAELIEQLRCAEHNYAVAQETIAQMKQSCPLRGVPYAKGLFCWRNFQNYCPSCGAKMSSRESK